MPHFCPCYGRVGHIIHVADDDPGTIGRQHDIFHIGIVHDQPSLVQEGGAAGIDHNDIGMLFADRPGNCAVPDRVTGKIERFFVRMVQNNARSRPAGNLCAVAGRNWNKVDVIKLAILIHGGHDFKAGAYKNLGILHALDKDWQFLVQIPSHICPAHSQSVKTPLDNPAAKG